MKDLQLKLFRCWIAVAVVVFLVGHVSVILLFTFVPNFSAGNSRLAFFYEYFVHLGPFYREEAIQSSPHFEVEANGGKLDLIGEFEHRYNASPMRPDNLILRRHTRATAEALSRNSRGALGKVAKLIQEVDPTLPLTDSVTLIYYHSWYDAESGAFRNDTVFNMKTILVKQ